ncbi:hypothetical protein ACWDUD_25060 [Rhodococcus sp. NPDC003382]
MPHVPRDPLTSTTDLGRQTAMTTTIEYSDGTAPRLALFARDPRRERVQMPFTEAHRTALKEVAAGIAGCERIDADIHLDDRLEMWTDLEDGMLVWDAGDDRLRFAAVEGVDGTYVEVLTGPRDAPTLTVEANWPITIEFPRETARTIWQLIGLYSN